MREAETRRYTLARETGSVRTSLGDIRYKRSAGYGVERLKYEYDDLARIAKANDLTLAEIRAMADRARAAQVHHL